MIDAVLFEFEGVIADTSAARRRALLDTLREDGVGLTESEYVEHCAAMPVRASVFRLSSDCQCRQLARVPATPMSPTMPFPA